uniref:ATAQ protein n=1 Tax=Haemaphysalis elliptica TaxID=762647 RepID=E5D583_9ACAR|nr:ATAQ protein [Haemaphysalis elliptica]
MQAPTLVSVFILVIAWGSASPIDGDGGVCATAGRICGPVPCVPQNGGSHFTCDCGKDQYFNATAQRCYHVRNCIADPCISGVCRDDDGRSARTCDCSNINHMTPDCRVEEKLLMACGKYFGGVMYNEDEELICSCPFGMKFNGDGCESIACGVSAFTCTQICGEKHLREDKRCCQGWDTSCYAVYEENTYCKPGTVPTGKDPKNLNCTNICAIGRDPCEYSCTYKDSKSPQFTCTCPEGKELYDVFRCRDKTMCNENEEVECSKKGQRCVVRERRAVCKCPDDKIFLNGGCIASCTEPKKSTCATTLGECKIIDNVETCVCSDPLIWDEAEKKCILEKQFIYDVQFEFYEFPKNPTEEWWALRIDRAMKNLYGKSLRKTRLVEFGKTSTTEMTFAEEPDKALLNRILHCRQYGSSGACLFAPDLYVVNTTAKAPMAVDICTRYIDASSLIDQQILKCHNDGDGKYSIRCRGKNTLPPAKHGELTVVECDDKSLCTEEKSRECQKSGSECVVRNNEHHCENAPEGSLSTKGTSPAEPGKDTPTRPTASPEERTSSGEPGKHPSTETTPSPNGGPNSAERFATTSAALLIGILIPVVLV